LALADSKSFRYGLPALRCFLCAQAKPVVEFAPWSVSVVSIEQAIGMRRCKPLDMLVDAVGNRSALSTTFPRTSTSGREGFIDPSHE